MALSDSTYQHACSILVGVATLFRFIGYDMGSFIVESLAHSAHVRNPSAMIDHAGYYGQAIKEVTGCIATLAVPALLNYMRPKWALVLGSAMFTFYIGCFGYLTTPLFLLANVVLGLAYSLSYTAFSTYQMQFSSRQTLARNSATIWSIASCSLVVGGGLYIYVTSTHSKQIVGRADLSLLSNTTNASQAPSGMKDQYRYYSEDETRRVTEFLPTINCVLDSRVVRKDLFIEEIFAKISRLGGESACEMKGRWLCGLLAASCCISTVLHCFYPSREVADSVSRESPSKKTSLSAQIGEICRTLTHPHVLLFLPRFLNHGLFVSFYMNVFPTTLQYSTRLASAYPMLTAYYAFAMCAGATVAGFLIAPLSRRIHDFGLRHLYYATIAVQLATYLIMTLTVPNWSTARPTTESAFFEPGLAWVCVIAFLLGFADTTNVSSNSVICTRLIPGRAAHTFSAARFYFGIAAATIFFCSPWLTIRCHAAILAATAIISAVSFNFAVNKVEMSERIANNEHSEPTAAVPSESKL